MAEADHTTTLLEFSGNCAGGPHYYNTRVYKWPLQLTALPYYCSLQLIAQIDHIATLLEAKDYLPRLKTMLQ